MLWKGIYKGKGLYVKSYCCSGLSRNITYKGVKSIIVKVEKVGVIFSFSLHHTCPTPKVSSLDFGYVESIIVLFISTSLSSILILEAKLVILF